MASSTGSIDNSYPNFTFSSHPFISPSSFSDLLSGDSSDAATSDSGAMLRRAGGTLSDRVAERAGVGWGVPKFKSLPPPSLPLSPPSIVSPSSYFAIPAGLSPAELLDSPVLLSTSNILPSPTTGTFAAQWKSNTSQSGVKKEDKIYTDFSFHTQTRPNNNTSQSSTNTSSLSSLSMFQSSNPSAQLAWTNATFQEPSRQESNNNHNNNYPQQAQSLSRRSDDGYNWRKYGQKQVKGSENPRSYYKCTYPTCPTKKKVERGPDGQITEIVYKGSHNHPKPQSTRRSSSSNNNNSSVVAASCLAAQQAPLNDTPDQSYASPMDSGATPENSSISVGDDEYEQSSQKTKSGGGDEFEDEEPDAKRWKREGESEGISAAGNRTVREPRVVVQTTSDIDILDDGYRWRKYGQKVVKGNPNPRSYYKCTNQGCPVRKHVERAAHDLRAVITTYEGKHNHDVPAARGSGLNRPQPTLPANNMVMAIRPSANNMAHNATMNIHHTNANSHNAAPMPFTLEMLQGSRNSAGFNSGPAYGNPSGSYMNYNTNSSNNAQSQLVMDHNGMYSNKTKDEPRDDNSFLESLLSST